MIRIHSLPLENTRHIFFLRSLSGCRKASNRVGNSNIFTMIKSLLSLIVCTFLLGNIAHAQLPVWPLVTGFPQSGPTINTVSTTPHQYVDWTVPSPSAATIPSTASNNVGPTQAGINGCNELVFFTLHNGLFPAASSALEIYTPTGTYLPLPGGDMNASAGDDEVQIVRRPGYPNQWFVIYNLAPSAFPAGNPGYQACYLAYSLIEVNPTSATYVLDGGGLPIQDRILSVGGTDFQYFNGKATSRTSVVVGYDHDIYVQRRSQTFGLTDISTQFQIDRFSVSNLDAIVHTGSSSVETGYTWSLMAAGSPIEFSPTENSLAVMARTQVDNQQQIYLFDPANLTAAPNTITISDLWIEFTAAPAPLPGLFHQANEFDLNPGTSFDWLQNFERKISGLEYSPNGDYLYICGGGFVSGSQQNLTYLAQIDLNQTITGDHVARLQVQQANLANTYSAVSGGGNFWNPGNYTNLWEFHSMSRIQSCYDGNLYFTKGRQSDLFVLPNPNSPLPINMNPGVIDFSTALAPNIPMNGFVAYMPDQIDGFDYSVSGYSSVTFNMSNQNLCSCDTLHVHVVNSATQDTFTSLFLQDCPQAVTLCLEENQSYDLVGDNGVVFGSAIISGNVAYPIATNVFNFGNGGAFNTNVTTITNPLITSDEVWEGKYFIPAGMIVTIDNAELDLTNCDLIFGDCAGMDFINGSNLRANNSVFRPCEIDGSWKGLQFIGGSIHDQIINECTFKNAEVALYFNNGADGVVSNNLFSNCNHGVYVTTTDYFNHPISGNRYVIDDFYPQFIPCYQFIDPTVGYGVKTMNANMRGEISHNEFVYAKEPNSQSGPIATRGVDMELSGGQISENTFTNIRNAIVVNNQIYTTYIENNEIEFNNEFQVVNTVPFVPAGGISAYNIGGSLVEINGNELRNNQGGIVMYGIYGQNISNVSANSNNIDNYFYGIYFDQASSIEITNNVLTEIQQYAITYSYAQSGFQNFITCNDISMKSNDGIGILTFFATGNENITSNCVKDALAGIVTFGPGGTTIPYIRNNYVYNYRWGIYSVGHTGNIGTFGDPGLNTLWSNNNAAVDILSTTTLFVADNFGMFNISFPQVQITSNIPSHSTASCGHQIFNMPSQGNLNTSFICDHGTDFVGKMFVDGNNNMLSGDYLDVLKSNDNLAQAAVGLIRAYNGSNAVFVNQLITDLELTGNDAQVVRYEQYMKANDLTLAGAELSTFVPVTLDEVQFKFVQEMKLKYLNGQTLTTADIAGLNDIVLLANNRSNDAAALIGMVSNEHKAYTFVEIEAPEFVDLPTKRVENDMIEMTLSPNPANDQLTIDYIFNNDSDDNTISVYDVSGGLIFSTDVSFVSGRATIDIRALASGMYLLTLENAEKTLSTARFVKE